MCTPLTPLIEGAITGGLSETATLNFSDVHVYDVLSIQRWFIPSKNDCNDEGEVSDSV